MRIIIFLGLFFLLMPSVFADGILEAAQKTIDTYRAKAELLAKQCEARGLVQEARATRDLILPMPTDRIYVPVFPTKVEKNALPSDASDDTKRWHEYWHKLRSQYAMVMSRHAVQAIEENQVSLAVQIVLTALHADPNNEALRNVLGYKLYNDEWRTDWEIQRLKNGYIEHETFGWLQEQYVKQYEQGQRYYRNQWITKEEEAELRRKNNDFWLIKTEHYDIRTNYSLEFGVEVSRHVETLYRVWKQVFIQYAVPSRELSTLFAGKTGHAQGKRLNIQFFDSRASYIQHLRRIGNTIEQSIGYFDEQKQCCYFFVYSEEDGTLDDMYRNVYHEGTHQLFSSAQPTTHRGPSSWNFWATEAIAIYMETLRKEGNYFVLGNPQDDRVLAAKYRLTESHFYIPFANLVMFDMVAFQSIPELPQLYSQCGGLGYFMMHYGDGRYRDRFIEYLIAIYSGKDTPQTLFQLMSESPQTLDKQYMDFIETIKYPE